MKNTIAFPQSILSNFKKEIYGIFFTVILGLIILFISSRPLFSKFNPLSIAIIVGILLINTVKIPKYYEPGIKFSNKTILKLAIIIFGIKLNFKDALAIGNTGIILTVITITLTFFFTYWIGRKLGLNNRFIQLIAAGTSICGTSAIVATNAVVKASEEDTAYSIVTVTTFGTVAMVVYPLLGQWLNLSPSEFGFWCGISIQQTAQVIAASFQHGMVSGDFATITKLSRVIFLIPTVILLGCLAAKNCSKAKSEKNIFAKISVPWFVLLFLGMSLINTYFPLGESTTKALIHFDSFLFIVSMVAMGLETKISSIKNVGFKPFYLAGLSWLFISLSSLILIKLFVVN